MITKPRRGRGRPSNRHLEERYVNAVYIVLQVRQRKGRKYGCLKDAAEQAAMSVATLKRYLAQPAYVKMAQWWLEEDNALDSLTPLERHKLNFGLPQNGEEFRD